MIFTDIDEVTSMYVLTKGNASFVIPQYDKLEYIKINQGNYFGVECIVGSMIKANKGLTNLHSWLENKQCLVRQFSAMA